MTYFAIEDKIISLSIIYLWLLQNGQTALSIAQRLGYISVVDTLKDITEVTETIPASDDKYKVVSPETMQEAFLSDSEDEGGMLKFWCKISNLVYIVDCCQ